MVDNLHYKEWEMAQKILSEFDERIHDIRKYGFSFLTALIAAEAILIPGSEFAAVGEASIPDSTKLGVMLVTLLLIVTIRVIERTYQLFLKCAAQRAQIIERSLNLELTEIITDRHRKEYIPTNETLIYMSFVVGVGLLGSTILFPNLLAILILLIITLLVLITLILIQKQNINAERQSMDWTINPLECSPGEKVRITVTNLDIEKSIFFKKGTVWKIQTQDKKCIGKGMFNENKRLRPEKSFIWEWGPEKDQEGICDLLICLKNKQKKKTLWSKKQENTKQKYRIYKLRRKIIVRKEESKKDEPINLQFFYSFPQHFPHP